MRDRKSILWVLQPCFFHESCVICLVAWTLYIKAIKKGLEEQTATSAAAKMNDENESKCALHSKA